MHLVIHALKRRFFPIGDYEEQRRLRRREALPWIFEDEVGDMGFVGRLEGDISPNYVLFIYEVPGHFFSFQLLYLLCY